ncbi:hypothetical protein SGO_0880 [Streptococcus gordonii str. Challis substr. CH1]|uniref:Uncharacterized protein n=1 Tax=Streptococcus gordonii (strain Challis / ATCC 35105 / BCRC 15272 / CH1 / DL1 / V288) TaxID=467705 RepID=A8AWL6_STRGC|nr:hypothetical protein SGO_0880 [Streptococcus gordonii str. Challis substr. CH1]
MGRTGGEGLVFLGAVSPPALKGATDDDRKRLVYAADQGSGQYAWFGSAPNNPAFGSGAV